MNILEWGWGAFAETKYAYANVVQKGDAFSKWSSRSRVTPKPVGSSGATHLPKKYNSPRISCVLRLICVAPCAGGGSKKKQIAFSNNCQLLLEVRERERRLNRGPVRKWLLRRSRSKVMTPVERCGATPLPKKNRR